MRPVPPAWVAPYVGLPWLDRGRDRDGLDCWGLFRLVLAERFGVMLPSFSDRYATAEDLRAANRAMDGEMEPWRSVVPGGERAGDGLLMSMQRVPCHVGAVIGPGLVLHIEEGVDSFWCSFEELAGRGWRIAGIFRHESLLDES